MKRLTLAAMGILLTSIMLLAACGPAKGGATAATKDSNYTVRIGFPASSRDTRAPDGPDIWAVDQGLFDQEFAKDGIKVEYTPFLGAAPAINEALAAGSLDMTVVADIGALIGKAAGAKTSLVGMGNPDGTTWWLLVGPNSKITKMADLKGKKVATVKATLPHFYLLEALKANGMQASDIDLVNMTMPDSEQALRAGQIDAAVFGGTGGARLISQGFKPINSTKETPIGRGTMVIVATYSFIAAHPSFFPRYFRVRQKATDWANANPDKAIDIIAKAAGGIDRSLVTPLYPTPFTFDQSLTTSVLARVKEVESFLRELQITRSPVDVDAWINKTVQYRK